MAIVEMSKGYQITIPADIRHKYDIDKGTKFDIETTDGEIILKPLTKADLKKLFKEADRYKCKLSVDEMEKIAEAF